MKQGQTGRSITTALLIVLALLALRTGLAAATFPHGSKEITVFCCREDQFADILKASLAQTAISAPLLHDPRTAQWPLRVQGYLFNTEQGFSVRHMTPFGTLVLMGVAKLLWFLSPQTVVGILVGIYLLCAMRISGAVERWGNVAETGRIMPLIILSFPSLFMIDRGNFHSGFTSLGVLLYVMSVVFRRSKWAGWIALAVAVNLRPNVAIFALLELLRTPNRFEAIKGMVIPGALSLAMGLVSLWFASHIDPAYNLRSFAEALAIYKKNYIEGIYGLGWNGSLANIDKLGRVQLNLPTIYNPVAARTSGLIGMAMLVGFSALTWTRRITLPRLVFALAAICCVFTPVLGEYHMLVFAAALLALLLAGEHVQTPADLWRGAAAIAIIQALCYAYALMPAAVVLLAAAALSFPFVLERVLANRGAADKVEQVLTVVSIAALVPLGGELGNGVATALILGSTLVWLLWRSVRMGATAEPNQPEPVGRTPTINAAL